jgi:hypothetical protein
MTIVVDQPISGKRSLIQMAQQVAAEVGLPQPAFLVSNTDNTASQLLALANHVGEEVAAEAGNWGGWPQLRKEFAFTIGGGVDNYAFPSDLQYLVPSTGWSRSYRWQLLGPLEAQEWQVLKSGISPTGPRTRYRIMAGRIYFDPVPQSSQDIAFEYFSNCWCQSTNGAPQTQFQADTDQFLLPDRLLVLGLKWRMLRAKGLDYTQEFSDFKSALERELSRAGSARNLPLNAQSASSIRLLNADNVPDTGFGA